MLEKEITIKTAEGQMNTFIVHPDINLTVYTSNFGATIELDQKVYTWTDKVYITIVAETNSVQPSGRRTERAEV
jgi:menaquinone-dependent protoporphyrinogen IX oxidase